jgi:hypothetical protein
MQSSFPGIFPFGQPSTERTSRRPRAAASAFVLGIHASALYVRWRQPQWLMNEGGVTGGVRALAVDVEPSAFWDGADAARQVDEWKKRVAFREGEDAGDWGRITPAGSVPWGRAVIDEVLKPLALQASEVWFADAVPWYFVRHSQDQSTHREQGDAIDAEYAPLAAADVGAPLADLPTRPSANTLVRWAVEQRREILRAELTESDAPLLVTLGEEARRVAVEISDSVGGVPKNELNQGMKDYGAPGELQVAGRTLRWLALYQPGQKHEAWTLRHQRWAARQR